MHPGGEWHGGIAEAHANPANGVAEPLALLRDQLKSDAGELTALLDVAGKLQAQIDQLPPAQERETTCWRSGIDDRMADPPFKTTIDEAAYPEMREITGQWYD